MSANTILLLQSVGIFLQMVNASLTAGGTIHNPTLSMLIAAACGAYQFYIQHLGNQTTPAGK